MLWLTYRKFVHLGKTLCKLCLDLWRWSLIASLCQIIENSAKLDFEWGRSLNKVLTMYVGVRNNQGIRMIKRSEMSSLGGATFWDNHLPAITTILTPILVCLKPKILPIRWCHFLWQSPACVRGCVILYVGKSRLSCKRFSPFNCHLIGSHFLRQSPAGHRHDFHPFFSLS